MNKAVSVIGVVSLMVFGCSPSAQDEACRRVGKAVSALNGRDASDERIHKTPNIVAAQQQRDILRQNTEWTPENQVKHPIEYCNAKLEELDGFSERLEVSVHKLLVRQSEVENTTAKARVQIDDLARFLKESKESYRRSESESTDRVEIGGYSLNKEQAKMRIVEAAHRMTELQNLIVNKENILVSINKKIAQVQNEQKTLLTVRKRVEATKTDMQVKEVMDGETGISSAIEALNNTLSALSTTDREPTLDDVLVPDAKVETDRDFEDIMKD